MQWVRVHQADSCGVAACQGPVPAMRPPGSGLSIWHVPSDLNSRGVLLYAPCFFLGGPTCRPYGEELIRFQLLS